MLKAGGPRSILVVIARMGGDDEVCCHEGGVAKGASGGKRMSMCITSILPDQASNRRLLMDFYENDMFVHFLVCAPAISAQAWRN